MKQLLIALTLIINTGIAVSQDLKSNANSNPLLTKEESTYLNQFLKKERKDFSFKEKKVAFISIDLGLNIRSKADYFNYYYDNAQSPENLGIKMIVLDSLQHLPSTNYDAIILLDCFNKKVDAKRVKRMINKLIECDKEKPSTLFELGVDDNPMLSPIEAKYFNSYFKDLNLNFSFKDLKIGFFYNNNGSDIQTKVDYFNSVKNRLGNCDEASYDLIIKLTASEKEESGGYDLVIVSWSKMSPTANARSRMVEQLAGLKQD